MDEFDSLRPRSSRAQARLREGQLKHKLERLLATGEEETFKAGLQEEFGITPDHPRFGEMLKIWRASR